MNTNIATWFEIPVTNMERAKQFYSDVLQTGLKEHQCETSGFTTAIFDYTEPAVSGMLIAGEGYEPSRTAMVIYLNGGKDLAEPLERAVKNGGEVLWPKTAINDGECGYFAQFLDTEGNRVGLYSKA